MPLTKTRGIENREDGKGGKRVYDNKRAYDMVQLEEKWRSHIR